MSTMTWAKLVGQQRVKGVLAAALESRCLGHAYLFCGDRGAGTFAAALDLARALLCGGTEKVPCGSCPACRKVAHHAHPDLHIRFPISLQGRKDSSGKLTEKGWDYVKEQAVFVVENPYRRITHKSPPVHPVELTRELTHAVARGPLEAGAVVAVIDDVDLMRRESANAMLKMLEEPPANTHIILLTEKLHTVLPTIVSRCQIVRFGALPPERIREALSGEFGVTAAEEEVDSALESAMGSLGRALELAENPSGEGKERGRQLWNACLDNDWLSAARVIDEAASVDGLEQREQMVLQLMFLARNEVVPEKGRREKYFTEMNDTVKSNFPAEVAKAEAVIACCREAVAGLRAYGNASLVLVCLAQSMMELLHGKEYQTG